MSATSPPPKLSLCMIVKDEAGSLGRCLESVRELVDEIVVVDTGSADDTVAIAESFGAHVVHETWADDYSTPRNVSLRAATGDWLLVLDADEVLSRADHAAIRAAMADTSTTGYRMRTRNYVRDLSMADAVRNVNPPPEGKGFPAWVPSDKVRLFRAQTHIAFRGAIHEVVDASITERNGHIALLDVPVHHYGFVERSDEKGTKLAMQRRLAERKVADAPNDFKALYELAVIGHSAGDFVEARTALERSLMLKGDWALSHYELGYVCEQQADWAAAVEAYGRALALDPAHLSAGLNLGVLLLRARKMEEAERVLQAVTEHYPDDARGWNNLGAVYANSKKSAEAAAAWREALRVDPDSPEARQNLATLEVEADATPARPRVSLCMIVRDEEANLRAAVEPLTALVDEIIIVDTGSVDGTVAVAEALGAQVVHFPWCDDFAAARNVGLARATGEWIVWLDADDRVPERTLPALASALLEPADHAVQWCIESQSGAHEPVRFLQLRQFPRRGDVTWRGRIHEEVTSAVRAAGVAITNEPAVVVVHTGYRDPATLHRKHERNLRLLELEVAERPDSATVRHHLAQMYRLLGRVPEAKATSACILDMEPLTGDERYLGLQARVRLAQFAIQEKDIGGAAALLQAALEIVPHFPPAEYALAELRWKQGDYSAATSHCRNVARAQLPLSEMPIPMPALRAGALNILGRIAQETDHHADALEHFTRALEECPHVAIIHANLADSLLALNRQADAAAAIQQARDLAPDDSRIAQRADAIRREPDEPAQAQPILSLCMIVRDEAPNLRELLPLVASAVDDLVIVDTGSQDDTVAVAKEYGARVFRREWTDDFSAARNAGLDEARGRFVLWLDADDRVDPGAVATLRRALTEVTPQAIRLPVESAMAQEAVSALSLRVFPTGRGVRWRGRVHEDLVEACLAANVPIVDSTVFTIRHEGYADAETLRTKLERNRRLMEQQLAEQPDDARLALQLAQSDRYFGAADAADARLVRLLAGDLPSPLRAQALGFRAAIAEDAGDIPAWQGLAAAWLREAPDDSAARVSCAHALTHREEWAEAATVLEGLGAGPVQLGSVPVHLEALERRRRYLLGLCYRHLGRFDDAVSELGAAVRSRPDDPDVLFELGNAHWDAGQPDEADAAYATLLEGQPRHALALVQRGNIAFQRGQFDQAEHFFAGALQADPDCRPARENACAAALARGDRQTARTRLVSALDTYPDAANLRVYLADLQFTSAEYGPALDSYRRFLLDQPTDVKALTRLGDCLRYLGHPSEARHAYDAALGLESAFAGAEQGRAALQGMP